MENWLKFAKELGLQRIRIRGDEIFASCPFAYLHLSGEDKNPSFSINIRKGVYHCFSCGSSGPIERLVMRLKDISLAQAYEMLYEHNFFNFERDEKAQEVVKSNVEKTFPEELLSIYEDISDAYAEKYKGIVEDRECIIYPIRTFDGKLVGASARSLQGRFHKNLWHCKKKFYLYGEDRIEPNKPILIVEGCGDAIAVRKAGFNNVVSIMGMSLSDEQAERLLKLSNEFIVWLDNDQAGYIGTKRIWEKLDKRANVKYVDLQKFPEIKLGGDPKDAFEKYGSEKVLEIIASAKTYLELLLEETI